MRRHLALSALLLASVSTLGTLGCTSSKWCAECGDHAPILGLNYQTDLLYTAGTPISANLPNPAGGTPVNYTVLSGTLPPGLLLDPTTGFISGTPTTPGVYTLVVLGTNPASTARQTIQITVVPAQPLALSYNTPMVFAANAGIPVQLPTLGYATPGIDTAYAVTTGALPAGLVLDPTSGTIAGSPTTPGINDFTITATNGTRTAARPLTYTITPAGSLTLTYPTPVTFAAGTAIATQTPTASAFTPGIPGSYAITTGTLPPGLTFNADGTITGTPTTPGVYSFGVTLTNGSRTAYFVPTYTVTPAGALTLSYTTPVQFTQGTAIASQAATVGNATPGVSTSFALTGGSLPGGLSLSTSTGAITGTPTTPGVFAFTIAATNGARNATATPTYTVVSSSPMTLSYASPQFFPVNSAIAAQSPTTGFFTPGVATTYAVTSGSLPAGLTLNTGTGAISGTPSVTGVSTFTVTATNGTRSATSSPTYVVEETSTLGLAYVTPRTFTQGTAIASQTGTVTNATAGVTTTFAVTSGSLPAGLTLNADGTITGTPTTAGVFTFTVTATNGTRTATSTPTYTVESSATLTVAYTTPRTFTQGTAIATQTPTVGNATPGVTTTYAVTSGSLPAGLTLNADGTLTGTPTTAGVSTFTVTATNGTRTATSTPTYTVESSATLTIAYTTPQTFTPNVAISTQTPTVGNETPGVTSTFAVTAGSQPTGLTLNANGTITGTPTAAGVYAFTVTVTNGTRTATSSPTWTVQAAAPSALNYTTPVSYLQNTAITTNSPNPSGGAPTSYAVILGTLPAGLSLNTTTGDITGTPTAATAGSVNVTIRGTNAQGNASQVVNITVIPAAPTALNYSSPVTYTNGTAITANSPNPTGGTPTSYAITSGILPAGLSIDPTTGIISGTPTAATAGTVSITIQGTNVSGSVSQTISITVNDAAPTALNYGTPKTYTNGTPIQVNNPNPTGGTPSSYTITSGSLPAGLSLDPVTGVISGKPTAATGGAVSITIRGTNGVGNASQTISITVNNTAPTALNYSTPVVYILGTPIAPNEPNPVGGAPTSYAVTAGSLPAGLTLNPTTGVITGTPTALTGGPVNVTITGTNASGSASKVVNINVPAPIVASFAGNPTTLPVGQKAELSALFSGGTGTIDQSIGPIASGASLYTPVINSPQSITYTLTVTNGVQTVTAPATITWVPASSILTVPVSLSGGGGVDVTTPGDPFEGLKVVVPTQGSVCADTTMTIIKSVSAPAAIPAPAIQVSESFSFSTDIGYPFKKPVTVTLPYDTTSLAGTDVPVPFYWDPVYSKWVANGIKSFDPVTKRVTFTTLLPGNYVVLAIPNLATSLASTATGFTANVDGWFQPNQGVFDLPGGSSFGMSAFASWYFSQRKVSNNNAGLYTQFRQGPVASDDVAAKALISRLANGTMDSWSQVVDQANYTLTDAQTGLALITALRVTSQPQIFMMGEARPVVDNALATIVWSYDNATQKFHLMDPNYPGTDLTITWNPAASTGGWTAYDRAAGYFPTFTQYAFEGHTSIHRLVDYERAFQGSNTAWPNPPFAQISLTQVGNLTNPTYTGSPLQVQGSSNITISGTVTNGDETTTHVFMSENGGPRTQVALVGNTFTFTIPTLADPYVDRIMLETTSNPCDPTFAHSGFLEFKVKDQALQPWFGNSCFEAGYQADGVTPVGWTIQQGSNSGVFYPASPTFDNLGNMVGYNVTWSSPGVDSTLVSVANDPIATSVPLPQVLDGTAALRVNNSATGAHISRATKTITVPTSIAHPQLSFYWSAVLESAGHPATQQPYADVLIQDVTDPANVTTVYFKHFAAQDPTYPGWQITGNWGAIPWQKVSLPNLTALKGRQLRITLTAADCTQTGHGGYMYMDNVTCD